MSDKLTDLIDQMVEAKTFSLDALNAIQALKSKALAQETEIERLSAVIDAKRQIEANNRAEISKLTKTIADHAQREDELSKREAKVLELQLAEARAVATAAALRESFGIVFKNTTVRESVQRTVAVPVAMGPQGQALYPQLMPDNSSVERTAE